MKLIVNADDFGLTKGVALGILDCIQKGIVTETTAMVDGLYFEQAMEEAKKRGYKNIGIHLTFTWGKPVLPLSEVSSLVNENGTFYKLGKNKNYKYDEVEKELRAQIEKFMSFGIKPTHMDGHHHFFGYDKRIFDMVINLAKEYKLPLRNTPTMEKYYKDNDIKTTQVFLPEFYDKNATEEVLLELLSKYRDFDSVELMCHPAYVDEELINTTSYNTKRKEEFGILTSEKIKNYIAENNIQLATYNDL